MQITNGHLLERRRSRSGTCVRWCVPLSALCLVLAGCGDKPEMVPVRGTVLYKDKALEYGSVMFQPAEGGELARGQIQSDGTFELTTHKAGDGVVVGTSRVRITAFDAQRPGGGQGGGNEELALGRSAVPARYQNFGTSGLTVDVSPDMKLPIVLELD